MENNDDEYNKWISQNENKWISAGIIVIVLAISTPFMIMWISKSNFKLSEFENLGTIGDFFGGSTVGLLSLASVCFVIAAIVMQKRELELQRAELELTRNELKKSNEQYVITNETMKLQQFETTFFNMINIHSSLINDLKFFGSEYKGREVIVKFYTEVNSHYRNESISTYLTKLLHSRKYELDFLFDDYAELVTTSGFAKVINEGIGNNHFSEKYISKEDFLKYSTYIFEGTDDRGHPFNGLTAFKCEFNELFEAVKKFPSITFSVELRNNFFDNIEYKKSAFDYVNKLNHYPLSNYIKSVKSIINFVDQSNFDIETNNKYLNIFFSQFTIQEITILNYLMKLGNEVELKEYFAKYNSLNTKEKLVDSII